MTLRLAELLSPKSAPTLKPRLSRLLRELEGCGRALGRAELADIVTRHPLSKRDLAGFLTVHRDHYAHREIYKSRYLELGVIGWRSGQQSPIHDHHQSACCVLVLEGALTNLEYEARDGDALVVRRVRRLHAGDILSYEGREIHSMMNTQPAGVDLHTLHVYSPPLPPMKERLRGD